jgi:hypothetical protein
MLSLLSLKTKNLSQFSSYKDNGISQHDHQVDQQKKHVKFHVVPPNKNAKPPQWQSRERNERSDDREP